MGGEQLQLGLRKEAAPRREEARSSGAPPYVRRALVGGGGGRGLPVGGIAKGGMDSDVRALGE